jgi:hypothetical protein
MKSSAALLALECVAVFAASCSDDPVTPEAPTAPLPWAAFEMSGRILGPVSQDDRSDIEITLRETAGVAASLNLVRLTCTNRATQEWGAASFVAERGTNRIDAFATLVFRRSYVCPSSGRPAELIAELTDANGHSIRITAAPYHPDWPGA